MTTWTESLHQGFVFLVMITSVSGFNVLAYVYVAQTKIVGQY